MKKALFSFLIGFCCSCVALAQDSIPVIQLSRWSSFDVLDPYVWVSIDSSNSASETFLKQANFKKPPVNYLNEPVSRWLSAYPHYYKSKLKNNTTDTLRYYIMGAPQKTFQCFKQEGNQYLTLPLEPYNVPHTRTANVTLLQVLPGHELEVVIKLSFPFYTEAYVYLYLVPQADMSRFLVYLQAMNSGSLSFQWLIYGMLAMMFLYILLKYIQLRALDYLYYSIYIFFFLCYFGLKLASSSGYEIIYYSNWYAGLVNNQLQVYAYIMYFLFFQSFLNTRTTMPTLHVLFKNTIRVLLAYLILDTLLFFFPEAIELKELAWNICRLGLAAITFIAIVLMYKSRNPLGSYLIVGGFILVVLGMCAMVFSISPGMISYLSYPFDVPITYFQIGIVAELICFTLGLGYKNRVVEEEKVRAEEQLQAVTARVEFERYRTMMEAREHERARIAKDLHDGVGGLLSGVKMSLTQMQQRIDFREDDNLVFARSLDMLDGSMQEIRRVAHAMMPPSLQQFGLKAALRDFVEAINSMKTIEVTFQVFGTEPKNYPLDKQLIIYRIVQELVNNVLKHAHANKCLVQVVFSEAISITVEDDGVGFDQTNTTGAGIINIRQRLEFLNGTIEWDTASGNGTSVMVEIPFT